MPRESRSETAPVAPALEAIRAQPPATPGVSAPVLIRQAAPAIRSDMRRLLTRDVIIEVAVDIDVRGTVTRASVRKSDAPFAGLLGPAVISAALQHQFKPAMVGGHPVPSQSVLIFRFGRER